MGKKVDRGPSSSVMGSACTRTWQQLLACRILLGLGMGIRASVGQSSSLLLFPTFCFSTDPVFDFSSSLRRRGSARAHPRLDDLTRTSEHAADWAVTGSLVMHWQLFVAFGIFLCRKLLSNVDRLLMFGTAGASRRT